MRAILITASLLLHTAFSFSQIKGNKDIQTKVYDIKNLEVLKINLYAKITVDNTAKEQMLITTDSNLFEYIDTENVDGTIGLDQLKWISPSQDIVIKIGAPNLKRLEQGTHDTTEIINLDNDYLNVMGFIGKVNISGKTKQLNLGIENGLVNAKNTTVENGRVNIWGQGKVTVNVSNELFTKLSEDARISLVNQPKKLSGDVQKTREKIKEIVPKKVEWITFKIKNNSWNRHNFAVKGPKSDGSKFGYGFPMLPGKVKKERWSVGTKVYKVSKLGVRKLLITVKAEDEGKVVKLFDKG